ncbi:MAG TPA: class I SAM-dependent methyltransferase [Candidatus Dormibacteraeota bacterium]|nr:class I SAM-dependent methyltransferase [Candidatus Dormibacteraeota bacterium]
MIGRKDPQGPVTEYFQKDAAFWESMYDQDDVFSVIHRDRALRAIQQVGRLPLIFGSRALEVGCGAGLVAVRLAERGYVVEATDSTPAMVEATARNAERAGVTARLHTALADAHALEYPGGSFDLVIALGVLPWLHNPKQALGEMARVLRPGGYLVANVDNRARLTHLLDPLFNPMLQPLRRAVGKGRRPAAATTLVWAREFDRQLAAAGLRKEKGLTFGFGPFTFMGRHTVRGRAAVALHTGLQQLADERLPVLRSTGTQYLVVARKGR